MNNHGSFFDVDFIREIEAFDNEKFIIEHLKKRVDELYFENSGALMQHLYRLDVSELLIEKFQVDLNTMDLAKAIWNRQKQKLKNWNQGELK